ncbi:MAG: hypothetical protein RJA56_1853 [Pseudomonadota bacterium]
MVGAIGGLAGPRQCRAAQRFEALPLFIAGVLIAQAHGAASSTIDALAVVFVLARVSYIATYLADRANLRTLSWVVALGCAIALFFV